MQIFLSYAREDRRCAELLADALSKRGWSVWWDRKIQVGHKFSRVIERELKKAKCVIVLWSRNAVESDWVRSEARAAAQRQVLVPVRIEDVWLPLEFNGLHTAELLDWEKGLRGPEFEACLTSIAQIVASGGPEIDEPEVDEPEVDEPERDEPEIEEPPVEEPKVETNFCIRHDGQQFRTPDLVTLRRWAAEGRVRAGSTVFDPRVQRWSLASEVPDLRGAFRDPPKPAPASRRSRSPLFLVAVLAAGGVVLLIVLIMYTVAQYENLNANTDYDPVAIMGSTAANDAALAGQSPPPPQPQGVQISIENRCDSPISVAICFLDAATNQPMSVGWYSALPGQTAPTPIRAAAPAIYFHVSSQGETWHSEQEAATTAPIHPQAPFSGTIANLQSQPWMTPAPFFGRTIAAGQTSHTEVICP